MPIWFELVAMLLITYAAGLCIGFLLWGRELAPVPEHGPETDEED